MTLDQEQEILKNLSHHPERFGEIFDAYYDTILQYTLKRIEDSNIALDITSEIFLKAIRNIDTFTWRWISISHWLYRIANSEIALYFRKSVYQTDSLDELCELYGFEAQSENDIEQEYRDIETEMETMEHMKIARTSLLELPVKYQEVISLRFLEEKSIREIATIIDAPEWTVKSLISRGIEKLQKTFSSKKLQPNLS